MALVTVHARSIWCDFCWGRRSRILPGVILYLTYWFPSEYRARIVGLFMVAIPVSSFSDRRCRPRCSEPTDGSGCVAGSGCSSSKLRRQFCSASRGLAVLSDRPADARLARRRRAPLAAGKTPDASRATAPVGQLTLRQVLGNKHVLVLSVVWRKHCGEQRSSAVAAQIIKSYGLTNMQTGLLNAIPFALASVIMIWWGSRSDRTGERIWHASVPLMLTAVSLASALLFTSLFSSSSSVPRGDRHLRRQRAGVGGVDGVAVGSNRGRRPGADQCDQQSRRLRHGLRNGLHQRRDRKLLARTRASGRAAATGAWAIVWIGDEKTRVARRQDNAAGTPA